MASSNIPRERLCSIKKLPAYLILLIYLGFSVALAECAQITMSKAHRPFFIRYINSSMAIMLFIFPLIHRIRRQVSKNNAPTAIELQLFNETETSTSSDTKVTEYASSSQQQIIQGSFYGFMLYTLIGAVMHTGGGLLYYGSLTGITVPTTITLMKLKAIWVLLLSIIFLKHPISMWKSLAIIVSFLGIFCYVEEVREAEHKHLNTGQKIIDTWWGCLATLVASIIWAIADIWMNITFKKFFPHSKYFGSLTYEAWIGLWTIPIFWFTIVIEQQPLWSVLTEDVWKWIILTGIVLTIVNSAFFTAISVMSPVWMNYASFLTIPCSFVVDVMVHQYRVSVLAVFGAFFIVFGFLMLEVMEEPQCFKKIMSCVKQNVCTCFVVESHNKLEENLDDLDAIIAESNISQTSLNETDDKPYESR